MDRLNLSMQLDGESVKQLERQIDSAFTSKKNLNEKATSLWLPTEKAIKDSSHKNLIK